MSIRERNLNFVDLFAGGGGLSLGLEEAGFRPVFVNELNEDALATYLVNRKDEFPYLSTEPFFSKDVKDLVLDPKKLDVLKSAFKEFHKDVTIATFPARIKRSAQLILFPYFCLMGQSKRRALSKFPLSGQLFRGANR